MSISAGRRVWINLDHAHYSEALYITTLAFSSVIKPSFTILSRWGKNWLIFSSGAIFPKGSLGFYKDEEQNQVWKLPDCLQFQEGDGEKELGPLHPEEM